MAEHAPHASLADPHVVRAVIGAGLYLALIGLLGLALGVLLRYTAGALTVLVVATVIVPYFFGPVLPPLIRQMWPIMSGMQIMAVTDFGGLVPWAGFGILLATVAALLGLAGWVFRSRDP